MHDGFVGAKIALHRTGNILWCGGRDEWIVGWDVCERDVGNVTFCIPASSLYKSVVCFRFFDFVFFGFARVNSCG